MKNKEKLIQLISAVIPFFNEAENVASVIKELYEVLCAGGLNFEIIAVDDGSNDGTVNELTKLRAKIPELHILKMRGNGGQTRAMAAGITNAKGDWILTLDGDG